MIQAKEKQHQVGPRALRGSSGAKRQAAVLLEALSGLVSTQEASEKLSVALPRYYQLETRALQGMIDALEPRSRGRRVDPSREQELLRIDNVRLLREVRRYQSLLRAQQRALGLASGKPSPKNGKSAPKRKRRRRARADAIASALSEMARTEEEAAPAAPKEE